MDLRQPSPWWQSWGCSALGKLDRSYLYLSNLAVCPQFRRQGVASHLLALCEQMARQWYFSQLYLHVLEENPEAKYLYFKGGYERLGTETRWDLLRLQQLRRSLLCKQLQ
jgi:ribosomal protein S18 acetylase RimI-like enzyme